MICKSSMCRAVQWWFRQACQRRADRHPWRMRRGRRRKIGVDRTMFPDDHIAISRLRHAVVRGIVEIRMEHILSQQARELFDECDASFLAELIDVLEQEETRRRFTNESREFEHELVAVVAEVGAAFLAGEALAGRAAGEQVDARGAVQ